MTPRRPRHAARTEDSADGQQSCRPVCLRSRPGGVDNPILGDLMRDRIVPPTDEAPRSRPTAARVRSCVTSSRPRDCYAGSSWGKAVPAQDGKHPGGSRLGEWAVPTSPQRETTCCTERWVDAAQNSTVITSILGLQWTERPLHARAKEPTR